MAIRRRRWRRAVVLPCVHMRVGVRELRQHASELLRRARAGERIEVTSRGVVVAVLGPPPPEDALERLKASGRLKPATWRGPLPAPMTTVRPASLALEELRAEER